MLNIMLSKIRRLGGKVAAQGGIAYVSMYMFYVRDKLLPHNSQNYWGFVAVVMLRCH